MHSLQTPLNSEDQPTYLRAGLHSARGHNKWSNKNLSTFSKDKCKVLQLRRNKQCRLGATESDLQVLVDSKPNRSQQWSLVARIANRILGCISRSTATRLRDMLIAARVKSHLNSSLRYHKTSVSWSKFSGRSWDDQKLERLSYQEKLKEQNLFIMQKRWLCRDLKAAFPDPGGGCREDGITIVCGKSMKNNGFESWNERF